MLSSAGQSGAESDCRRAPTPPRCIAFRDGSTLRRGNFRLRSRAKAVQVSETVAWRRAPTGTPTIWAP
eukprot:3257471-Pyramimonas_sp.AAC.1